jgi:hypothetical protein
MTNKRKRADTDASRHEPSRETESTDCDTTITNSYLPVAERTFEIQVLPEQTSTKKRAKKTPAGWSHIHEQEPLEKDGIRCSYRIKPAKQWESLKKYNNFVVSDKMFGVGDYVYIYHGNEVQGTNLDPSNAACWVAQVLEIRAADACHVYIRIFWLYWPNELPRGREAYHGSHELVASNLMEVMDATTVTDKAEVTHLHEDEDAPSVDGLYWRQTFNCTTKKLSVSRIKYLESKTANHCNRRYGKIVSAILTITLIVN